MNKKTLILLIAGVFLTCALGLSALWYFLGDKQDDKKVHVAAPKEEPAKETAAMTSVVEVFQINMPCKPNEQGNTPIVHADFQLMVPLKYRLKAEESTGRIRDIMGTILRNSEINDVNGDNLVHFKQQVIDQVQQDLGIKIEEVLVLNYSYDMMRKRQQH